MDAYNSIEEMIADDEARWCVVEGWLDFPHYAITRDGKLWSVSRNTTKGGWREASINSQGYYSYRLCNHNGAFNIKRSIVIKLVWHGPPSQELINTGKRMLVRHLNDVRSDDRLENLEWGTGKDNAVDRKRNGHNQEGEKHCRATRSSEEVVDIREALYSGKSRTEVMEEFNVNMRLVQNIATDKTWNLDAARPSTQLKLKVLNKFLTLNGECVQGGPLNYSTFVRLGGCNIRCWKSSGHCDSPNSLDMTYPYPEESVEDIIKYIQGNDPCNAVTITGGEPMLQPLGICILARQLKYRNYKVSLETSGSILMTTDHIGSFNCVICDLKPPSTEMDKTMKQKIFPRLRSRDFIKVVIQDRNDFDWALDYLDNLSIKANIAFGPRWGFLEPRELESWLRESRRFDIRLNVQMHKYIWPECATPLTHDLKLIDRDELLRNER